MELQLNIKTERNVSIRKSTQNDVVSPRRTLPTEKTFVEKIIALKTENNKNLLALKKSQSEHAALLIVKQNLEQNMIEIKTKFEIELKNMQSKLSTMENDLAASKSKSDKIINELKSELFDVKNTRAAMESKNAVIVSDLRKEIKVLQGLMNNISVAWINGKVKWNHLMMMCTKLKQ